MQDPRSRVCRGTYAGRVVAFAVLCAGAPATAHHSIAGAYDRTRPVTVTGTVRQFHFVNPHPWIEADGPDAAGRVRTWRMEMDNRNELAEVGMSADTLKPGDRIVVSGAAAVGGQFGLYVRKLERPKDGMRYAQEGSRPVFTPPAR